MTSNLDESTVGEGAVPRVRNLRRYAQWMRPIGDWLLRLAVVALAVSAVVIAIEQHRQTDIKRNEACYSRVAALAQIALVDVTEGSATDAEPGLRYLECDRISGIAP